MAEYTSQNQRRILTSYNNFSSFFRNSDGGYTSWFLIKSSKDDKSGKCKSNDLFRLPENDVVLEAKQRRIMRINISSSPLILLFFTPFDPFLRKIINTVKNRWMNADEYESEFLSLPTDIEDNISDNGEYNIGYYSETN
ncbi:PIR Superfamily Protein [Plasmodium ovale wallikeri]|uniref:PIR Superfamily Protein n=1 Tax=Plasmodium ovale wallikeri TaxID=864142 RepID=A0A1A9AIE8_PLAOA|nr:PIR Superfamily Protein [Plasmodium ovale wallikeri]